MTLPFFPSRRELLSAAAGGFGAIALRGILAEESRQESPAASKTESSSDPLAAKRPHVAPRARSVIFLYMTGGVSHVDTFDHKPKLAAEHGKSITVDNWQGKLGQFTRYLKGPGWKFAPGGTCGTQVSDLFS